MNDFLRKMRNEILRWHRHHVRDFPWRHTKDPYKIMIAEFMLHRTRAEQVVPIYLEFIKKYPDIFSLAEANYEDIKNVTKHLGLHWRHRHFIDSARYLVKRYNGKFPENYDDLRKIPGVGTYVAGAIMATSFSKPAPIIDSNIARFINRLWGLNLKGEIRRKKKIVQIAHDLFTCKNPSRFLFAIVDFASIICKPKRPRCDECPLRTNCKYFLGHR